MSYPGQTNFKHTYFPYNTLNYLDTVFNSILCISFPRLVSHSLVKGTTQRLVSHSVVKVSTVAQYKYTRILREAS